MNQAGHSQIEELLGAYALDALDPEERAQAEEHLRTCASCRREVDSLRETAAQLSGAEPPAPTELWNRIADSLEETPTPIGVARISRSRTRRQRFNYRLAAGMAAALVIMGFLGLRVVQQGDRIKELEAQGSEEALLRAATLAEADPAAEPVALRSPDDSLTGDAVILPDGRGFLVSHNLPDPDPDHTYQLWALIDDIRISLGVIPRDSEVTAFQAPPSATGIAITEERAGGVSVSDKAPLVVGLRRA